ELGERADAAKIVIETSPGRAVVTVERPGRAPRAAAADLPSKESGDVERAVALFVGELVSEPDASVDPSSPSTSPPPVPDPPAEQSREPRPTASPSVAAGATTRLFGGGAFLVGPFVEAGTGLGERLRLSLIGSYAASSADDPLGTVSAQVASGGLE